MGFISKIDILDGRIVLADMFRRIIDALDGTRENDIRIRGELQLEASKLKINGTAVTTSANELNGLAARTAGTTEANKPLVVGSDREVDYLRVNQLAVNQIIEDAPPVSTSTGKVYATQNFY